MYYFTVNYSTIYYSIFQYCTILLCTILLLTIPLFTILPRPQPCRAEASLGQTFVLRALVLKLLFLDPSDSSQLSISCHF